MYLEDPKRKTADIIAAAKFLATRPEVDANKVVGLGICASAGYMAGAALTSDALKSIALIAPWLHDSEIVNSIYGGSEGIRQLVETSRKAEAEFMASGTISAVPAASVTDATAIMYQAPYYTDPNRGFIPQYDNKFNLATWEPWLTFDAIQTADKLEKPTLLVHSEAAAIPQGAKKFAERGLHATTIWLEDVTQFDFYDKPEAVAASSDAAAKHFEQLSK